MHRHRSLAQTLAGLPPYSMEGTQFRNRLEPNQVNIFENGLFEALIVTRVGGDAPLFDRMLTGVRGVRVDGLRQVRDPGMANVTSSLQSRYTNRAIADASGNSILFTPEPGLLGTMGLSYFEGPGTPRPASFDGAGVMAPSRARDSMRNRPVPAGSTWCEPNGRSDTAGRRRWPLQSGSLPRRFRRCG